MSPARRPKPHRLRRDRREVVIAIASALAVLLVTAVLLWVLAPDDEDPAPSSPPITLPTPIPDTSVPDTSVPDTTVPDTSVPDTGTPAPGTGETSTTVAGG